MARTVGCSNISVEESGALMSSVSMLCGDTVGAEAHARSALSSSTDEYQSSLAKLQLCLICLEKEDYAQVNLQAPSPPPLARHFLHCLSLSLSPSLSLSISLPRSLSF